MSLVLPRAEGSREECGRFRPWLRLEAENEKAEAADWRFGAWSLKQHTRAWFLGGLRQETGGMEPRA